jgi:hypothetical protein
MKLSQSRLIQDVLEYGDMAEFIIFPINENNSYLQNVIFTQHNIFASSTK